MVVGEVIGLGKEVISQVLQMDVIMIFIILFIFIIIAYKIFKYLMKAFITGMAFGFIPILANFLGFPVEISFAVIFQYMIFGILVFVAYSMIHTGLKIVGFVLSPFKGLFKKKQEKKVVTKVQEDEKKH